MKVHLDQKVIIGVKLIENGIFSIWSGPVKDIGPVLVEAIENDTITASYFWDFVFGDYEGYTKEGASHFYYDWDPSGCLGDFLEKNVPYSFPYENKEDYINLVSFNLLINKDWEGCEN